MTLFADLVSLFQLDGSMIVIAENVMGSTRIDENDCTGMSRHTEGSKSTIEHARYLVTFLTLKHLNI